MIVLYFYLVLHKDLQATPVTEEMIHAFPTPTSAIVDKKGFIASCVIFLCAVVLLITHATTGLTVSTIGVFIAAVTLIAAGKHIGEVLKGVDYKTLLFFVGLFVVVGGLEQTGILNVMADFIGKISGGNFMLMIAIIILLSAVASAFVDNIPCHHDSHYQYTGCHRGCSSGCAGMVPGNGYRCRWFRYSYRCFR